MILIFHKAFPSTLRLTLMWTTIILCLSTSRHLIPSLNAQTVQQAPRVEIGSAYSGEHTNLQTRQTGPMSVEVIRTDRSSGFTHLKIEWPYSSSKGEFEGAVTPAGEMNLQGLVEAPQSRIFEARLVAAISGRTMRGTYTLVPTTGADRPQQQGEFFLLRRR